MIAVSRVSLVISMVVGLVACGGAKSSLLDGNGDGGGGGDAGNGDGGCVNPTEGAHCNASDQVCAEPTGGNCCGGTSWACSGGTWQASELGCACPAPVDAGPFACGEKTCASGEYCMVQPPGIAFEDGGTPPTSYDCVSLPSSCGGYAACGCIESQASCPIASCGGTDAHITLYCLGE